MPCGRSFSNAGTLDNQSGRSLASPGWIAGTTSVGELLAYRIYGPGDWRRHELRSATWQGMTHLVSPGVGIIYGRTSDGALNRYLDSDPYDGSGAACSAIGSLSSGVGNGGVGCRAASC